MKRMEKEKDGGIDELVVRLNDARYAQRNWCPVAEVAHVGTVVVINMRSLRTWIWMMFRPGV